MRKLFISFDSAILFSLFSFPSHTYTIHFPLSDSFHAIFQYKTRIHDTFRKKNWKRLSCQKMVNRWREQRGKMNKKGAMEGAPWSVWWRVCEWGSGNLITYCSSAPERRRRRTIKHNSRQKALPSMRSWSIVHGLYSQSVAAPHSQLDPWCHSNDSSAVKIWKTLLVS